MKSKFMFSFVALLFGLLTIVGAASAQTITYKPSLAHKDGAMAYEHMKYLTYEIGQRVAGSPNERLAEQYIKGQFDRIGLKTKVQPFTYTSRGKQISSSNVIAYKPGKSAKQIIVGAHYDSVSVGRGADDNASGVGVLLEVAEVLKNINTPYSIVFIAFGAEEPGLKGSSYYANHMTSDEIDNTVGMINMDSLAVGDHMFVYGDEGEAGFIREQALAIVNKKKLNVGTNPGLNPDYPAGTTGDWSDHAPFKAKGIPYGYLESTNWEIGDLDGYTQTVEHGEVWHTPNDSIDFIENAYPGRIQEHLSTFSVLLTDLLKFMDKTSTSK
ncbi:M20/M25/M40 family metallo-hydrolase [Neobacillus drentensis]|uniref:M20/M25/M40 family metallo-hydrolase n=1 Tax=Neobacillus drentensis TaxID=220684 RepID=UPI001F321472|nr:M20/M25/M40 family metallo-hydrolase [Neobacillus drentensis]ULT59445.1 M20/M25/M40 family metallo-hydrolase [Neobacillus drentensis]